MNKSLVTLIALLLVLAGAMGLLLYHAKGTPSANASATPAPAVASSPATADNTPAPTAVATPAVASPPPAPPAAPAPPEPAKDLTLAQQLEDFTSTVWRPMKNGMDTDILSKDEIRIHGTTQFADWAHCNGLGATTPVPDGDFTVSVDIKIAKFDGDTQYKNPYLRVEARNRSAIGIFANIAFFYRLHDWKNPQTMSTTHKMFGDEATKYHRMSLKWEEAAQTATATVDGEPIGSIKTQLGSGRRFSVFANSTTKGIDVDVYFRNLKVEIPAGPDAAQP